MTNINFKLLFDLAGLILIIVSVFFSLCIPVALIYSEPILPFVYPLLMTLIPGVLVYVLLKSPLEERISAREGYLSVTLAWIIISICGALPYFFSGIITNFPDAWFESTSGFTTTGASILPEVESILIHSFLEKPLHTGSVVWVYTPGYYYPAYIENRRL
jgi:trk system potassium uptake protein TrkH